MKIIIMSIYLILFAFDLSALAPTHEDHKLLAIEKLLNNPIRVDKQKYIAYKGKPVDKKKCLDKIECERYRIGVDNNKFINIFGNKVNTIFPANIVLLHNMELFLIERPMSKAFGEIVPISTISHGKPVRFAGIVNIKNGVIKSVSNINKDYDSNNIDLINFINLIFGIVKIKKGIVVLSKDNSLNITIKKDRNNKVSVINNNKNCNLSKSA